MNEIAGAGVGLLEVAVRFADGRGDHVVIELSGVNQDGGSGLIFTLTFMATLEYCATLE